MFFKILIIYETLQFTMIEDLYQLYFKMQVFCVKRKMLEMEI